jgi:ABC-2 type transport system ATP-binding protein
MRVELRGIAKRYGKVDALAGVDLDLASGSRVALIGPNGSGKTTLTRVVMGLVRHEGTVLFDGSPQARAQEIAYVPQVAPQMAATVGELIRTVADVRGADAREIERVAAELGLEVAPIARRPFRGLSGGMKQKLLIALALGVRPRLIVLDEPTASLDAAARARFVALQRELLDDATVVLCSHRIEELRTMVDRVVALEDGRIVHDAVAQTFVRDRTTSIIELLVDGHADWLRSHGFTRASGGWWTRAVDHTDKMRLVPKAIAALDGGLRDLVVRDRDRLDEDEGEGEGEGEDVGEEAA